MIRYAITAGLLRAPLAASSVPPVLSGPIDFLPAADYLQIRERSLPAAALLALARRCMDSARASGSGMRILVNARLDVALASAADGVHLPAFPGQLQASEVRRLYARAGLPPPVVSLSCHTLAEIDRAVEQEVSLILFGPVFEKRVAGALVSPGVGLDLLRQACARAGDVPVLALGGITPATADACVRAGAAGVAGIRLFQGQPSRG